MLQEEWFQIGLLGESLEILSVPTLVAYTHVCPASMPTTQLIDVVQQCMDDGSILLQLIPNVHKNNK